MISELFELVLAAADDYSPQPDDAMTARQDFLRQARDEIDTHLGALPYTDAYQWRTKHGGIQGNVSPVPWIRLYDARYSPRTTEGFYLCWLFGGTGDAVHLSLNQGTSEFRSGKWRPITDRHVVAARADSARASISWWPNSLIERGVSQIDLGSSMPILGVEAAGRIRNYEVGHVAGFTYSAGRVPDDATILDDLRLLTPLLAELYQPSLTFEGATSSPAGLSTPIPGADRLHGSTQGRTSDRALNRAIELRAMKVACDHLVSTGWACLDVSAHKPYDIEAHRANDELHLEVKGTTSAGSAITLTMGEVRHAQEYPRCALAVVAGIRITYDHHRQPIAEGGSLTIWDPWTIEPSRLLPTQYRYTLDEQQG